MHFPADAIVRRYRDADLERLAEKLHRQCQQIAEVHDELLLDVIVPLPSAEDLIGGAS